MVVYSIGDKVVALYNGEWHPAKIDEIEQDGVYTLVWEKKFPQMFSTGYLETELHSNKGLEIPEAFDSNVMNTIMDHLESEDTQTDDESSMSLDTEWSVEMGVCAAREMLDRYDSIGQTMAQRDLAMSMGQEVALPHEVWRVTGAGAPCYHAPNPSAMTTRCLSEGEMLVPLQMFEAQGSHWLLVPDGMWLDVEDLQPVVGPARQQREPWMFEGCRNVELLARRALDRKIMDPREGTPVEPSPTLETIQRFLPTVNVLDDFWTVKQVCNLDFFNWNNYALASEILTHCLRTLWTDIRKSATVEMQNDRGGTTCVWMPTAESVADMRLVKFLVRHRFDCATPEFLRFVLQTGRIRVSNYLYAAGPIINKHWTKEITSALAVPLRGAKSEVLYHNVQALLKFGYMLPLERIIRGWKLCSSNGKRLQTRLKNGRPETVVKRGKSKCLSGSSGREQGYIHFAWPHDRALRTFKASARLYSNQASREAKARALHEECLKMGAPHIEDIILGFVNNFKPYSSPDPLYDQI